MRKHEIEPKTFLCFQQSANPQHIIQAEAVLDILVTIRKLRLAKDQDA